MKPMPYLNVPRLTILVLSVYWIALATATHVPKLPKVSVHYGDKVAHYVAYAGLAFLLSWAWTARRPLTLKGMLWVFLLATVYGAVDELLQIPIPGRYGEWYDLLADMLGAATGVCLFWCLDRLRRLVWRGQVCSS